MKNSLLKLNEKSRKEERLKHFKRLFRFYDFDPDLIEEMFNEIIIVPSDFSILLNHFQHCTEKFGCKERFFTNPLLENFADRLSFDTLLEIYHTGDDDLMEKSIKLILESLVEGVVKRKSMTKGIPLKNYAKNYENSGKSSIVELLDMLLAAEKNPFLKLAFDIVSDESSGD